MKKILLITLFVFGIYIYVNSTPVFVHSNVVETPVYNSEQFEGSVASYSNVEPNLVSIYGTQHNGNQIEGEGKVIRILSDDNDGSRHQRFILVLPSGQTLLVAHNIDIAPRINSLSINDEIEFNGVYEWNSQGGVIHWTHSDPAGRHQEGWLKHHGRTYK